MTLHSKKICKIPWTIKDNLMIKNIIFISYPSVANANRRLFDEDKSFRSFNHVSTFCSTSVNTGALST